MEFELYYTSSLRIIAAVKLNFCFRESEKFRFFFKRIYVFDVFDRKKEEGCKSAAGRNIYIYRRIRIKILPLLKRYYISNWIYQREENNFWKKNIRYPADARIYSSLPPSPLLIPSPSLIVYSLLSSYRLLIACISVVDGYSSIVRCFSITGISSNGCQYGGRNSRQRSRMN